MEGGASHQAWVIVVAPGEPNFYCQRQLFCFVAFRLPRADQTGGEVQSGKLAWMNITAWLQGRKPRESNKLFDLFPLQANPLNPSYPW